MISRLVSLRDERIARIVRDVSASNEEIRMFNAAAMEHQARNDRRIGEEELPTAPIDLIERVTRPRARARAPEINERQERCRSAAENPDGIQEI